MELAILGAGAAGCFAACRAADLGLKVSVWEAGPSPGKKILATGNGRCNYTNSDMKPSFYRSDSGGAISAVLSSLDVKASLEYFMELGIYPQNSNGYYYPRSNQASSLRQALLHHMEEKGIHVHNNSRVVDIVPLKPTGFRIVLESGYTFLADCVLMACGGMAAPQTGSDGSGLKIAARLKHAIVPPVPALTWLASDCSPLHGVRVMGNLRCITGDGEVHEEYGEIQFTRNGISGIPAFQLSRFIARDLQQHPDRRIPLQIDLLPLHSDSSSDTKRVSRTQLTEHIVSECVPANAPKAQAMLVSAAPDHWLAQLVSFAPHMQLSIALNGLFPDKLCDLLLARCGLKSDRTLGSCTSTDLGKLLDTIHALSFPVHGVGDFMSAQVTAGGVSLSDVKEASLESIHHPGLFFAGEILDVDGPCGGYNLQWAWSSAAAAVIGISSYMNDATPIPNELREAEAARHRSTAVQSSRKKTVSSSGAGKSHKKKGR